jgi:predicted transcriptional regulator
VIPPDKLELTSHLVAVFVSKNPLPRAQLAALIESTHAALVKLEKGVENQPISGEPAVSASRSRRTI